MKLRPLSDRITLGVPYCAQNLLKAYKKSVVVRLVETSMWTFLVVVQTNNVRYRLPSGVSRTMNEPVLSTPIHSNGLVYLTRSAGNIGGGGRRAGFPLSILHTTHLLIMLETTGLSLGVQAY